MNIPKSIVSLLIYLAILSHSLEATATAQKKVKQQINFSYFNLAPKRDSSCRLSAEKSSHSTKVTKKKSLTVAGGRAKAQQEVAIIFDDATIRMEEKKRAAVKLDASRFESILEILFVECRLLILFMAVLWLQKETK